MAVYREIVSKTVLGKGKKNYKNDYTIKALETPTTILGCWVINHKFKGTQSGGKILVDGSFDVNIWFSFDNDSKTSVITKKIDYAEIGTVKIKEESELSDENSIIVRALKQPTCINVEIGKNNEINFVIEKELGIEVIGEAKIKILVDEYEEMWDEIEDEQLEMTEEIEKEIEENINEDFIK